MRSLREALVGIQSALEHSFASIQPVGVFYVERIVDSDGGETISLFSPQGCLSFHGSVPRGHCYRIGQRVEVVSVSLPALFSPFEPSRIVIDPPVQFFTREGDRTRLDQMSLGVRLSPCP